MSSWKLLRPGLIAARADGVDPYLRIADAINFVDHGCLRDATLPSFHVSVEVKNGTYRPHQQGFEDRVGHRGSRYFTAEVTATGYNELVRDQQVERVQFAAAMVPQRPGRRFQSSDKRAAHATVRKKKGDDAKASDVLLAIIDSGCPFAHLDLRRRNTRSTRVVRLWDQRSGATYCGLGATPPEFGYGRELTRSDLDALIVQSTPAGPVDEAACYRLAEYGPAMHRVSHGAHSLGMLAAQRRWNARPSSTNPLKPAQASEISRTADVMFVQFPHDVMDCVSVAALENRALDGFRYILARGAELGYTRIVVSFGYESWIGPHDGSTWFAAAVRSLLREATESSLDFHIYTIAGNAKNRRARVAAEAGEKELSFGLNVQPGNEAPTFVEIWAPNALADLTFELTPPHERPLPPLSWNSERAWPDANRAYACVVMNQSQVLGKPDHVIVLRIAPTHVTGDKRSAAPHGVWRIRLLTKDKVLDGVRAYVGRSEETLGASARARQSTFTGRSELQQEVDREGTVNGHAPGSDMNVSGAYFGERFPYARTINKLQKPEDLHDKATDYSGSGPLPSGQRALNDSITTEDGIYSSGVVGMGNYSGVLFRMTGTSVAAPLRARMVADADPKVVAKKTVAKKAVARPGMGLLLDPF